MALDLATLTLSVGAHLPNGEACVMEAVSQVAGEEWSDRPRCTDAALAAYLRQINDRGPQWVRDELAKRIPAIAKARRLKKEWLWVWAESARQSAIRALGPKAGLARCRPIVDRITAHTAAAAAAPAAFDAAAADAAADAAYGAVFAICVYSLGGNAAAAVADVAYAAGAAVGDAAVAAGDAAVAAGAYAADASKEEWDKAIALIDRAIGEALP